MIGSLLANSLFSEKEITELALLAEKDWEEREAQRISLIYPRLEEFRKHLLPTPDLRYPLRSNGILTYYPSTIEGGEIHLYKTNQETTDLSNPSEDAIALINEGLAEEGLPPVSMFSERHNEGETTFSPDHEEARDPGLAQDFFSIVEDIDNRKNHSCWDASLDVPLKKEEDGILISLRRQHKEESLEAIVDLEKKLIAGVISDEAVELEIFIAPEDPEELKTTSLDILAQGKDHPHVRLRKFFGENENEILREAEAIVLGEHDDPTPWVLSGSFLDKTLGKISIMITAENEKDLADYVKLVIPKGYWKKDF